MDPEIVEWLLEKADAHEADINHDIEETKHEQHVATVQEDTSDLEKESSTVKQQEANVTEIPSEEQLEEENLEEDNKLDNHVDTQSVTNASVTLETTTENQINEAIQVDTDKTDVLSPRNTKTTSLEAASKDPSDEGSSILSSKENTNNDNVEEDLTPAKALLRRVLDEGRRIMDKITWPFRQLGKSILKVFPSYIERKSLLK